ncbi:MAG: nucleoside hydrolase [Acidobacteriaceae bacterium]
MTKSFLTALIALAILVPASTAKAAAPVPVIFDTDMGNDVDDALALAMLHAFVSRGEVKLLAVTVSKDNPWAAEYVRMVDEYYGRPSIPVGIVHNGKTPDDGNYVRQVCELHHRRPNPAAVSDAVKLLRKTLATQPDGVVDLIQVGFSTNLARLLDSPPDSYSPLGGLDLVKKKVHELTIMGGNFGPNPKREYNIMIDVPAAKRLFADWPTEIYISGFEIGEAILYPASSIEHDFPAGNPVAEAYRAYMKMPYDRPSWDLTTVLYDLRADRGYFDLSPAGNVTVAPDGMTSFQPGANGKRYFMKVNAMQAAIIRDACVWLASQPK